MGKRLSQDHKVLFQKFSKNKVVYKTGYKSSIAKKSEVNKFLNFIIKGLDRKGFCNLIIKEKVWLEI